MDFDVLKIMLDSAKKITLKNDCVKDSGFRVGASLLTKSGKIYCGHNIENNGIQSSCSERTTFSIALSEGEREFVAILVVASPKDSDTFVDAWPCGYCREFMSKFVGGDFAVYTIDENGNPIGKKMKELAPLHDFSNNKNYNLNNDAEIIVMGEYFQNSFCRKINEDKMEEFLVSANEFSSNTIGYSNSECAILYGYNENDELQSYIGATIFDDNGTIMRAPRVAMLKALANGMRKFEKIITLKFENSIPLKLFPSYDTLQFLLQYAGPDLKIKTFDFNENKVFETTIKEELPNYFCF